MTDDQLAQLIASNHELLQALWRCEQIGFWLCGIMLARIFFACFKR